MTCNFKTHGFTERSPGASRFPLTLKASLGGQMQCSELHVRHHFWSVWTADAAFLRGFGPTVSSGLYPIQKCPQSGPRTWGLGGGLDRLNHRPLATSAADRSAIRNTGQMFSPQKTAQDLLYRIRPRV